MEKLKEGNLFKRKSFCTNLDDNAFLRSSVERNHSFVSLDKTHQANSSLCRQTMFNRRNVNKVLNGFYLIDEGGSPRTNSLSLYFSFLIFVFPFNLLFLDSGVSNSRTFNKTVINSQVYVDSAVER